MKRALNFNAGPAALPEKVLQRAGKEWLSINDSGMSVMELSHRSAIFEQIHQQAIQSVKDLLSIPEQYEVLLMQGGASLQFSMVPMNLLTEGASADYVLTGSWSEKALKEARKAGNIRIAASSKEAGYRRIPDRSEIEADENAAYLHLTSNNTIYGTQWHQFPDGTVPLVADMSSDIMSRPLDINRFGLIYAGAQKNLGPSGVTVVIIRKDLIRDSLGHLPTMLQYSTYSSSNSLYNTPPTLAIYLLSLVMDWVKEAGGIAAMAERSRQKAEIIYGAIDSSGGFYRGHADLESRSLMNITFNLENGQLEEVFLAEAAEAGFIGLSGHRSIGGCRASIYNAVPLAHCEQLADFMDHFRKKHT